MRSIFRGFVAAPRSYKQAITDKFMTLYIIGKVSEKLRMVGSTRQQKIFFLSQKRFVEDGLKVLSYEFYKWRRGPISDQLHHDIEKLRDLGFITENTTISENGKTIIRDCKQLISTNKDIFNKIDAIAERYSRMHLDKLLEYVYGLRIGDKKIGDINFGEPVISKREIECGTKTFMISDEWIETIDILFNKDFSNSALKSLRGEFIPLN